ERRLAESRGAREQDVVGGTLLDPSGIEQQLQLPAHLLLPDEVNETRGAKRALDRELGVVLRRGRSDVALRHGHRRPPARAPQASAATGPAPTRGQPPRRLPPRRQPPPPRRARA